MILKKKSVFFFKKYLGFFCVFLFHYSFMLIFFSGCCSFVLKYWTKLRLILLSKKKKLFMQVCKFMQLWQLTCNFLLGYHSFKSYHNYESLSIHVSLSTRMHLIIHRNHTHHHYLYIITIINSLRECICKCWPTNNEIT